VSALTATLPLETTPRTSLEGVSPASRAIWNEWLKAHRHADEPVTRRPIWQRFAEFAATWREERGYTSSVSDMVLSDSYQKVVALGRRVVPYILADLMRGPDHWFPALTAITGVNPIPPEAAGNMRAMASAWINWGEQEGLLD